MTRLPTGTNRRRRLGTCLAVGLSAGPLAFPLALALVLPLALVTDSATNLAYAQASATDWYQQGVKHYNLGEFDKAIESFKKAYEADSNAAYLYNIAQSYRQAGDCRNALFFYRRFMSLRGSDPAKPLKPELKAEIETRIAELDKCMKDQDALKGRPPDTVSIDGNPTTGGTTSGTEPAPPGTTGSPTTSGAISTGAPGQSGDTSGSAITTPLVDGSASATAKPDEESPKLFIARAGVGPAFVEAGEVKVPTRITLAATVGYPIRLGAKLTLEPGVGFGVSQFPAEGRLMESKVTLLAGFANVGLTYKLSNRIGLHGALGAGALGVFGLKEGNLFTKDQLAPQGGGLPAFRLRMAASGEFAATRSLLVGVTPAISASPPPAGFRKEIPTVTQLDLLVTVGYRH